MRREVEVHEGIAVVLMCIKLDLMSSTLSANVDLRKNISFTKSGPCKRIPR